MNELLPCTCGNSVYVSASGGYYVYCSECGRETDLYETRQELIEAWNQQNNKE